MLRSSFSSTATGTLVPVFNGPPDAELAFIPNPLPPAWEWPAHLWPLLLEARTALASLDGTGKHLPSPELLLTPLQTREAQLSSKLEGTITDPVQQALFQADPRYPISPDDPANALREVFNYRKALRLRLDGKEDLPLSLRLIRTLHRTLMDGVRGQNQRPGEFRALQNQIGRPARFVPPPPLEMQQCLSDFELYLHAPTQYDPLVQAFLTHYQFETIHPFGDGNGRVGRLFLAITIAEWCGLSSQWLYMSPYFEAQKDRYMDLLLRVSTHGAWESWIEFCLAGVVVQARDAERRCDRLLRLYRDFHGRLKQGSVRLAGVVDALFQSPFVSALSLTHKFHITHPTARADLKKLASLGILSELQGTALITYISREVYDVTYGDL